MQDILKWLNSAHFISGQNRAPLFYSSVLDQLLARKEYLKQHKSRRKSNQRWVVDDSWTGYFFLCASYSRQRFSCFRCGKRAWVMRKAPTGLDHKIVASIQILKMCAAGPFLSVIQQEQACLTTRCLCCNMWGPLVWHSRHGLGNWLSMLAPVNFYQAFLHLGKTTGDFIIWPRPTALHGCTNFEHIASS